jgi:hypothetical protein
MSFPLHFKLASMTQASLHHVHGIPRVLSASDSPTPWNNSAGRKGASVAKRAPS